MTPISPRESSRPKRAPAALAVLAMEAMLRLIWARAALRFRPFQEVAGGLGDFVPPGAAHESDASPSAADSETARAVAWAVTAAVWRMPFEFLCLPRGLAAQAMLRARGSPASLYFGAGKDEAGRTHAHAWVESAGIGVTGYPLASGLRELGRFVARPKTGQPGKRRPPSA